MRLRRSLAGGIFLFLMTAGAAQQPPLRLVGTIALPGVAGRIDHLAIDLDHQRLLVAALGNNTIEVVDVRSLSHVRSVKGAHEPQGLAYLPDAKQVVVANGEGGDVQFRDDTDFRVLRTVTLGDDADNVRYDAKAQRVFVGYAGGALAAISAADGRRVADVKLPGHPESFQLEASGSRIFVNVPSAGRIVVVGRDTTNVVASWPVTIAGANYPMALDERDHRLFIGCRRPAKVLTYDIASGKSIGSADIVGDTDDLFYDAARRRLYVTGGEGFVDVLQAESADLKRLARIPTTAGARTSLYVPEQNRLYVAVPNRGSRGAEIRVFEAQD